MKSAIVAACAVMLTGCASVNYTPPLNVTAMPNDCANHVAVINWLESQARIPKHVMEKEDDYERSRAAFRQRIWHVRYSCRSV
jgi:hypothetical protein